MLQREEQRGAEERRLEHELRADRRVEAGVAGDHEHGQRAEDDRGDRHRDAAERSPRRPTARRRFGLAGRRAARACATLGGGGCDGGGGAAVRLGWELAHGRRCSTISPSEAISPPPERSRSSGSTPAARAPATSSSAAVADVERLLGGAARELERGGEDRRVRLRGADLRRGDDAVEPLGEPEAGRAPPAAPASQFETQTRRSPRRRSSSSAGAASSKARKRIASSIASTLTGAPELLAEDRRAALAKAGERARDRAPRGRARGSGRSRRGRRARRPPRRRRAPARGEATAARARPACPWRRGGPLGSAASAGRRLAGSARDGGELLGLERRVDHGADHARGGVRVRVRDRPLRDRTGRRARRRGSAARAPPSRGPRRRGCA